MSNTEAKTNEPKSLEKEPVDILRYLREEGFRTALYVPASTQSERDRCL